MENVSFVTASLFWILFIQQPNQPELILAMYGYVEIYLPLCSVLHLMLMQCCAYGLVWLRHKKHSGLGKHHILAHLVPVVESGCFRDRGEKTKKGHQLHAVGHQRTEGHLWCNAFIVNWKGSLEGSLSRFIYHRGIWEGTLATFIRNMGAPWGGVIILFSEYTSVWICCHKHGWKMCQCLVKNIQ